MKHYGSTAIKYTSRQMIGFATCTCGWKSDEEVCDLDEVDEAYTVKDYVAILGALTDIHLMKHLERVEHESFDD